MPNVQQILSVHIRTREKVLYDGQALAVTSNDSSGMFDILPQHTNFISIIRDLIIIRKLDGTKEVFKLEQGVMKVVNNEVHAYLGVVHSTLLEKNANLTS